MTREQLNALAKKHFDNRQLEDSGLNFFNISPLDLMEFIYKVEEAAQMVFPTKEIKRDNFKDIDSIYSLMTIISQQ